MGDEGGKVFFIEKQGVTWEGQRTNERELTSSHGALGGVGRGGGTPLPPP